MPRWDSQTAQENLLPLSQEQADFLLAVTEWAWTGDFQVHCPDFEATCQLCENKGLVYHYQISNRQTKNSLWVGSSCIMRFDIAVYGDEGELLAGGAKKSRLENKVREFKLNQALEPLRALWKVDESNRAKISQLAQKVKQENGRLPPQDLLFLFRQMEKYELAFDQSLYRVRLRSNWEKQQLVALSEPDLQLLWGCLSEKQQEIYRQEKAQAEARARQEAQAPAGQQAAKYAGRGMQSHESRPTVYRTRQQQPEEVLPGPPPAQPVYELRLPVNFNERAHKFTVIFRTEEGRLLKDPLYRGSEEFCRNYVDREILTSPPGTIAQVLDTRTREVIYEVIIPPPASPAKSSP